MTEKIIEILKSLLPVILVALKDVLDKQKTASDVKAKQAIINHINSLDKDAVDTLYRNWVIKGKK